MYIEQYVEDIDVASTDPVEQILGPCPEGEAAWEYHRAGAAV